MFSTIFSQVAMLLILILAGYILRKKNLVSEKFQNDLAEVVLWFVLPCSVIASSEMEMTPGSARGIWIICIIACAYYLITILCVEWLSGRLKLPPERRRVFCCLIVFANTAFIGIPMSQALVGAKGVFYASLFNMVWSLFFFTYGVSALRRRREHDLKTAFTSDPSIITMLIMLAIFLFRVRLPAFLRDFLNSVGNMCTPMSMLVIGCMLSEINLKEVLTNKSLYLASALRLVIIPAFVLAAMAALKHFGIDSEVLFVVIIMCAMPAGSLVAVYAKKYGADAQYASGAILNTMLFFVITVPLILAVAKWLIY